jgi:hypothetical protein
MTCLLCASPAVADLLCVPCGAKLWAAKLFTEDPSKAAAIRREPWKWKLLRGNPERAHALDMMTLQEALDTQTRLEAKKTERAAKEGER